MSVELLAPAGDFSTALSAFAAGADAVYLGLGEFSARAFAQNFSIEELSDLVRYARAKGKKVYVAFNTLIDESDIDSAVDILSRIDRAGPDAVILQDLGIARICRRYFPGLEMHASTQLVAHNLEGVLSLAKIGFKRIVLARELSLAEISSIVRRAGDLEFEVFIHGALCYSVSGLCLYSAMEKNRSGNRGKCAYCCRLPQECDGEKILAYSMKDLRLGRDILKLAEAGVKSLKIEGRMKSDVYVASTVSYYRAILDGVPGKVSESDLETVFSRPTTKLYFDGVDSSDVKESGGVIDPVSLGHRGTFIGTVKRVTKDREGFDWLRFHTLRALERHDGLQFDEVDENGKRLGMGIGEMRRAISRRNEFEVPAGEDVEILLPKDGEIAGRLKEGTRIYCSASQAVRRLFPTPSFRKSEYPGGVPLEVALELESSQMSASVVFRGVPLKVSLPCSLQAAKDPLRTKEAAVKAFSKLGDSDYTLKNLEIVTGKDLFAPMSVLNELRRDLIALIDDSREDLRRGTVARALEESCALSADACREEDGGRVIKLLTSMKIPAGRWDEIVFLVRPGETPPPAPAGVPVRLALDVYTGEQDFPRLRAMVKSFIRQGFLKWEAADLATLSLLTSLGVEDITADWTLYAFNSAALKELGGLGVKEFVASPENGAANLYSLSKSGYRMQFLRQQMTPLFISLTPPAASPDGLTVHRRGNLWVTTNAVPRVFEIPAGAKSRIDLSWDAPC